MHGLFQTSHRAWKARVEATFLAICYSETRLKCCPHILYSAQSASVDGGHSAGRAVLAIIGAHHMFFSASPTQCCGEEAVENDRKLGVQGTRHVARLRHLRLRTEVSGISFEDGLRGGCARLGWQFPYEKALPMASEKLHHVRIGSGEAVVMLEIQSTMIRIHYDTHMRPMQPPDR
jgi:hypothetical protein